MHLPYRTGVGMMVLNAKGDVFVGKRIDMTSEAWQMPQGGVDKGETPKAAVWRELTEETGMTSVKIIGALEEPVAYDLPDELIPKIWNGKYRGQKQHWFVLRFLGEEKEIDLNTGEPELSEWCWVGIDMLPDIIVPFKRELYTYLVKEFRHLAVPHL